MSNFFSPLQTLYKSSFLVKLRGSQYSISRVFANRESLLRKKDLIYKLSAAEHEQNSNKGIPPLISVVMPFYNAHAFIRETVESVLRQDYDNFELIIVNDGSVLPTVEELLSGLDCKNIRVINHEKNQGLAQARNTAIDAARGDLIVPLDADDLIDPDFLSATWSVLESHPDVSAVFTQVQIFGEISMLWIPEPTLLNLMCGIPVQSTLLFKKELYQAVGGYSRSVVGSPDVDFWIRVLACGFKLQLLERPLYHYRKTIGSLSHEGKLTEVEDLARSNKELYLQNLDAVFEKESQKFEQLRLQFEELKEGYKKLFSGYKDLLGRGEAVKAQLQKKSTNPFPRRNEYIESQHLKDNLEWQYNFVLPRPTPEQIASGEWIAMLVAGEKKYFQAKEKYSQVQEQFQKLESTYLAVHADFDKEVEILKDLSLRNRVLGLLGLKSVNTMSK